MGGAFGDAVHWLELLVALESPFHVIGQRPLQRRGDAHNEQAINRQPIDSNGT